MYPVPHRRLSNSIISVRLQMQQHFLFVFFFINYYRNFYNIYLVPFELSFILV